MMVRKAVAVILALLILSTIPVIAAADLTNSEAYIPSETAVENEIVEVIVEVPVELEGNFITHRELFNPVKELPLLISYCEQRKDAAMAMADSARECGYPEDHPVIKLALAEWNAADIAWQEYTSQYQDLLYGEKYEEYPVATEVWIYLKGLGYNDYVCAGILGNMMAECGGGTLNLQHLIYNPGRSYYGLCQWSMYYFPEARDLDLQGQLNLLENTIKEQIDYAGFAYKSDFHYEDFLQLEDEREAALAFAIAYERCAKQHYYIRCDYAEIAYDYFVG